jgi:hypothetical protein
MPEIYCWPQPVGLDQCGLGLNGVTEARVHNRTRTGRSVSQAGAPCPIFHYNVGGQSRRMIDHGENAEAHCH